MFNKLKSGMSNVKNTLREKRIYKSRDSILGGVFGGIADYFGVDRTLVRMTGVILFVAGAPIVLAYVVAWVIMPDHPESKKEKGINKEN